MLLLATLLIDIPLQFALANVMKLHTTTLEKLNKLFCHVIPLHKKLPVLGNLTSSTLVTYDFNEGDLPHP